MLTSYPYMAFRGGFCYRFPYDFNQEPKLIFVAALTTIVHFLDQLLVTDYKTNVKAAALAKFNP